MNHTHTWWYKIAGQKLATRCDYMNCFINIKYMPERPVYLKYKVPHSISEDQAKFWVEFLEKVFPGELSVKQVESCVTFAFKCEGMGYGKMLLRLTAMRYLREHQHYVINLHEKAKDLSFAEQFEILQQVHIDAKSSSGHGLILADSDFRSGLKKPISHPQFLENLKKKTKPEVFDHFT